MIKFDNQLVSFDIVELKSITTALGGGIVAAKPVGKNEIPVFSKINVPMAVARAFIQRHAKMTRYLKPVLTCVVRYDNRVIALERHPLGSLGELNSEGVFGETTWIPDSQVNFEKYIQPLMSGTKDWYFDGRYAYTLPDSIANTVANAKTISQNNCFRAINVSAIDMQMMFHRDKIIANNRACIAYTAANGQFVMSPPVWKDVGEIGAVRNTNNDEDDGDDNFESGDANSNISSTAFNQIDEMYFVNLNFALKAGSVIGSVFGFEAVEPLQFPRLMIELSTVNLPSLPKHVKATFDTGMPFTHCFAWLLGRLSKSNSFESYVAIRQLLKYLTTKAICERKIEHRDTLLHGTYTLDDIPLSNVNELIAESNDSWVSVSKLVDNAKKGAKSRARSESQHNMDNDD